MLDWIAPALGFVSASLVALIALGFGAMLVFFSGSALLVFGQFLPFARRISDALFAALLGAPLLAYVAYRSTLGVESWPGSPALALGMGAVLQLICTLLVWSFIRFKTLARVARWFFGIFFLGVGVLYLAALGAHPLGPIAAQATAVASGVLRIALIGVYPLVIVGLIQHRRARPVEWFVSLRYLVAKRRQTFISVISVICVSGVALGVAVITVVLSVMNGFSRMWEEKIIGNKAHAVVQARFGPMDNYLVIRGQVADLPGVVGATPFLNADAIVRGYGGELQAIVLKGIDPGTVAEATQLEADLLEGSKDALNNLAPAPISETGKPLPGVILGSELANRFFVQTGDELVLISPMGGASTPLGPAPRLSKFRVAGVFRSNFFQFDEGFAYASLAAVQDFVKLDDVATGIEVRTRDAYQSAATALEIESALGPAFFVRDWKTFFPGFFQALKTERVMMFVLLSFIMVVAGFIIISTLIMMIMEKARDIAILKTMGCDDDGVLRVFAIQGVLIGVAGLALGLGMGLVITWNLDVIQGVVEGLLGIDVLPANVYQSQSLPYDIVPFHLALISAIALVLSIGATLLPSWQASRISPAEALRYE